MFYKTRMCLKFLEGNCPKGDSCTFAHGPQELREPPPNWQELVKDNKGQNWNDDQRIIHQMKICHKFANTGECPYGEKCIFLHDNLAKFKAQMERTRESSVIKIQTTVDRGQPNGGRVIKVSAVSSDPNATFLKNRICSKWQTTGKCSLGDKCHFAHGISELNTPVSHMEGGGSIATSLVHLSATELPPSSSSIAVPEGKGFAKINLSHKKINRIYGDWIDDEEDESQSYPISTKSLKMIQHPVLDDNNGARELFPQQNDTNSQSENSRDPPLVNASTTQSTPLPPNVRRMSAIRFFKTRMCQKFLKGNCPYGEMCNYAHGQKDMRQPPPIRQEFGSHERTENRESSVIVIQTLPDGPDLGRICYYWKLIGRCKFEDKCIFLHGLPEVQASDRRTVSEGQERRSTNAPTPVHQPEGEAKGFAKLGHRKLKGIYGDWIDD
ncbi:hypothetical protein LXL04_018270 [Taraxacum kok-saghyz]